MSANFDKESDLCKAFIECLPDGWVAYPETGGFDIILSRKSDGVQIGVEAKLSLNVKVLNQALEHNNYYAATSPGPDFRAVLVPYGKAVNGLSDLCAHLGLTIIEQRKPDRDNEGKIKFGRGSRAETTRLRFMNEYGGYQHEDTEDAFRPRLPITKHIWDDREWFERCPDSRVILPDYVPDVSAGDSAPVALTAWKIAAIKIVVTLKRRGYLTRKDFTHFKISMSRWTQFKWLVKDGGGGWIEGPEMPDFEEQHPVNYKQIEADFYKWKPESKADQKGLFVEI